jgi:pyruvate,water dikinase
MSGFWRRWLGRRRGETLATVRRRYERFQHLVDGNNRVLDLIADAEEKSGGDHLFDRRYLEWLTEELSAAVAGVVYDLNAMADNRYGDLMDAFEGVCQGVQSILSPTLATESELVHAFDDVDRDFASVVGEKAASLAELRRLDLSLPRGFVLSAAACRRQFVAAGIEQLLAEHADALASPGGPGLETTADRLQEAVRTTPLRGSVSRLLAREIKKPERARWRYAVRSSAVGEGGKHSFAGLHRTLLNVPPSEAEVAYREVLASLFTVEALRYRLEKGLPVTGALMAVAFLEMVPARASGVIQTVKHAAPQLDVMPVSAAWGLGPTVVQGSGPVDSFELSRDPMPRVLERHVVEKTSALQPCANSGIEAVAVAPADQTAPCISDEELARLGQVALRIEQHAGQHQEIEWAVGPDGRLVILQVRALHVAPFRVRDPAELARLLADRTVLVRGRGAIACGGVGAGPVHVLHPGEGTGEFPPSAVLVVQTALPQYAALLPRAAAVVTAVGSSTGHLATVAREYRVPMIVGAADATAVLKPGMNVTVDAEENVIYDGVVQELVRYHLSRTRVDTDFEEFRTLRRLVRRIAPLHLLDPDADNFRARSCTSCHDVIRFAHEMAVRELVEMPGLTVHDRRRFVRRLRLPIPLDLDVLDLGGGVASGSDDGFVDPEAIASTPLAALLKHLCGFWRTDPVDLDMRSFLSSATRGASMAIAETGPPRPNLAVVSEDYTNLHLHLGYHYNMVDCRATDDATANYIYFRFHGGVTEITRRSRRARTIGAILEAYGFGVETKGDMVIGRLRNLSRATTRERLEMIGRLIGYTRQLDVMMRDEGTVREFTQAFCKGDIPPDGASPREPAADRATEHVPG